jgi:hypothetical protein
LRSSLMVSFHLCLGLPTGLLPSGFPTTTLRFPATCPVIWPFKLFGQNLLCSFLQPPGNSSFLLHIPFLYFIAPFFCHFRPPSVLFLFPSLSDAVYPYPHFPFSICSSPMTFVRKLSEAHTCLRCDTQHLHSWQYSGLRIDCLRNCFVWQGSVLTPQQGRWARCLCHAAASPFFETYFNIIFDLIGPVTPPLRLRTLQCQMTECGRQWSSGETEENRTISVGSAHLHVQVRISGFINTKLERRPTETLCFAIIETQVESVLGSRWDGTHA